MWFEGDEIIRMMQRCKFILCHSAPGRELQRRCRISRDDQYPVARQLIANIQMQIDDNAAAGFFAAIEFVVKIPSGFRHGFCFNNHFIRWNRGICGGWTTAHDYPLQKVSRQSRSRVALEANTGLPPKTIAIPAASRISSLVQSASTAFLQWAAAGDAGFCSDTSWKAPSEINEEYT